MARLGCRGCRRQEGMDPPGARGCMTPQCKYGHGPKVKTKDAEALT
jgi:hypothetical protein